MAEISSEDLNVSFSDAFSAHQARSQRAESSPAMPARALAQSFL